mmetsp:Transcript_8407/g.14059  ORF Transcript_8407/g.14059 Transcript_8407/m.14059 type:complete len:166 (-) Transcript_8407:1439-1936(-)
MDKKRSKHLAAINEFSIKSKTPIENGLVYERRTTDFAFLIIFVLFMLSMVGMGGYGLKKGNITKLLAPIDSDKNMCGVDHIGWSQKNNKDYPKLYLTNLKDIQNIFDYGVCVKSCPSDKSQPLECAETSKVQDCNTESIQAQRFASKSIGGYCIPTKVSDLPEGQ